MKALILIVVWVGLSACSTTQVKEPIPHSPQSRSAMLIYNLNYGDLRLTKVDLQTGMAQSEKLTIPAAEDSHIIAFDADPILSDPTQNALQTELGWNLQPGGRVALAQKVIEPGEYAILSYTEHNSARAMSMTAFACYRDAAPIVRFEAGKVYYMGAMTALMNDAPENWRLADGSARSARLVSYMLEQKPELRGTVERVDFVDSVQFERPSSPELLQKECDVGRKFRSKRSRSQ